MRRTFIALVAALVGGACTDSRDMSVAKGTWGGRNIELQVGDGEATAQFKCGAVGHVNGNLALDASAHFAAPGTYEPKLVTGGPRAAYYSGSLSGRRLSLNVQVDQTEIGPFELQQGQEGSFDVCNFSQS